MSSKSDHEEERHSRRAFLIAALVRDSLLIELRPGGLWIGFRSMNKAVEIVLYTDSVTLNVE